MAHNAPGLALSGYLESISRPQTPTILFGENKAENGIRPVKHKRPLILQIAEVTISCTNNAILHPLRKPCLRCVYPKVWLWWLSVTCGCVMRIVQLNMCLT